jgi:hypothetical protein
MSYSKVSDQRTIGSSWTTTSTTRRPTVLASRHECHALFRATRCVLAGILLAATVFVVYTTLPGTVIGSTFWHLSVVDDPVDEWLSHELVHPVDRAFKVLQFADVHFGDVRTDECKDSYRYKHTCSARDTTDFLSRLIERDQVDLVVFTGDQVQADAGRGSLLRLALVLIIWANVVQLAWYTTIYSSTSIVRRYIDWFLTTPFMIISTVAVSEHFSSSGRSLLETLRSEIVLLVFGLQFNHAVLVFGVIAELKFPRKSHRIRRLLLFFGCVCRLVSFGLLMAAFGYKTAAAFAIWATQFVVWSVYGVVALFVSKDHEATSYNVLDTVSKNVFAIVISIVLLSN